MSTIKLLIADDEPMIREGLRDMLESFELNVKHWNRISFLQIFVCRNFPDWTLFMN